VQSRDYIFGEVDVQADVLLRWQALSSRSREASAQIRKLTDAAWRGGVFLVSHGWFHPENHPELRQFQPRAKLVGTGEILDNLKRYDNESPYRRRLKASSLFAHLSRYG